MRKFAGFMSGIAKAGGTIVNKTAPLSTKTPHTKNIH